MALAPGTKLGPYDLQSLLGAGGMGEVYRARDARLNRIVAIKVLPATFSADAARLQRFMQEARSAAALNHPNILSIFDIGEERGAPYIVSELLEGQTLRERIRSGMLSSRKAIDYALQVARGLAAAHEKGIVHRDLKPENVFITTDERVKILDFGLAKLTRPEGDVGEDAPTVQVNTEPGQIMGTVGYMSPEQVRGKPADHRSDIFAFGSILYEMLSGQPAFRGESAADTMSAILKEEPAELSETARNVPPALERMVLHCLEKNPAQRFQSAGDLAFNLEALTDVSGLGSVMGKTGAQSAIASTGMAEPALAETPARGKESTSRNILREVAGVVVLAGLMLGVGWWWGRRSVQATLPEYQPITFRTGSIGNARFTPDGSIVYSASWDGGENQLYMGRADDHGARELGLKDAEVLSISKSGELAVRLKSVNLIGFEYIGTLARLPMSGGAPREVLENVEDAEWAADGESMAVVRYVPESQHWRLEYPIGKVLVDGTNWISHPRISPDGKWIAFADHQNAVGDDEGAVAVIGSDASSNNNKERILTPGWVSLEGILWSPSGDEIWFTSTGAGSAVNPRAVTLSGKVRTITNVPGGMWLQDRRNEMTLMVAHRRRIGIRGVPPGGKEERELGWLDWSILGDLSRDGRKILFEEAGDGGGPNYTVFVRDSDGSPPVRIGEGVGLAISPDDKWVVTQPAKGGPLRLVPTGVGEARQLTHDNVSYHKVRWLAGGKELLASGVEPGHGARDYLIAVSNGDSKPITPEAVVGVEPSPDGRSMVVMGPDGKWGIWQLEPSNLGEGNALRLIPGLDSNYHVRWSPDGASLLAIPVRQSGKTGSVYRADPVTGKMELVRTLGEGLAAGAVSIGGSYMLGDGGAYAYPYMQTLSQVYVVRGMK
ncbi:MAG TPA: protein kinase [Terriglobales bacterium]|jgi:Tol biopolymer transport system component|nr:protein kinase [Terriglobales bacterium]